MVSNQTYVISTQWQSFHCNNHNNTLCVPGDHPIVLHRLYISKQYFTGQSGPWQFFSTTFILSVAFPVQQLKCLHPLYKVTVLCTNLDLLHGSLLLCSSSPPPFVFQKRRWCLFFSLLLTFFHSESLAFFQSWETSLHHSVLLFFWILIFEKCFFLCTIFVTDH